MLCHLTHMPGRAGSMTLSTLSTAMGDSREEYWLTTLEDSELGGQEAGDRCELCAVPLPFSCTGLQVLWCNLSPTRIHVCGRAPSGHPRPPDSPITCITLSTSCLAATSLGHTHVVAARMSDSRSSRFTGMAMDSRICRHERVHIAWFVFR